MEQAANRSVVCWNRVAAELRIHRETKLALRPPRKPPVRCTSYGGIPEKNRTYAFQGKIIGAFAPTPNEWTRHEKSLAKKNSVSGRRTDSWLPPNLSGAWYENLLRATPRDRDVVRSGKYRLDAPRYEIGGFPFAENMTVERSDAKKRGYM